LNVGEDETRWRAPHAPELLGEDRRRARRTRAQIQELVRASSIEKLRELRREARKIFPTRACD